MSNNPLEAVTQAVNSLVTALKLPDESAKANEVLGEMSFPQFSRLLPYRDYNQESGLFMNDTTMGFMLEAIPINGANESIVEALDHMLRTKLPRGVPFCIHLMSSQLVGDRIEYGLREFSWSGEQAERFNAITRAYYMNAAATQFPLPEGMNLPLTLRHYRVFFSYCSPSKKKSRADILEMENLVKIIRASLQGASITTQAVDAQAFIDIVGEMINHNPDSLYPKRRQLDPYSDLNYQCVEDSFDLKVRADYLTLGLRENGRNSTARIRNVLLPCFANAFTEAGFATITFDYRGFGESDGERGRLVPAMQTEDIISVINWAEKQECIDNQRIGLWGTSLGGGHVFSAAAQDQRVKCIVSQLAFADGDVLVTGEMNESERASFLSTLNKMAEKKKNTGKEMFVGVTRVLSDNESKVFFEKVKGQYPEMDIKIPFLTVMETLQYKPAESAAKVQCPVLIVIAGQDSVNPPEQGKALYDAVASGTKELYEEADACHYDIYEGAFFERVAAVQTQWFKKHL